MLYSLGMIFIAVVFYCAHLSVDSFSLEVKLGFMSKMLLIAGVVSLWVFAIPDTLKKEEIS